jgi:hypothetical protein
MLASITGPIISGGYLNLGDDVGFGTDGHNFIMTTEKYEVNSYLFRIDLYLVCMSII